MAILSLLRCIGFGKMFDVTHVLLSNQFGYFPLAAEQWVKATENLHKESLHI